MTIPRQSSESFLENYTAALGWLDSLGIKVGQGRMLHYANVLQSWTSSYNSKNSELARELFPKFASTIFEVPAFIDVYQAFRDIPRDQLGGIIEKLKNSVSGPYDSSVETPQSSNARNHLFEAVVASKIHRPDQQALVMLDAKSDTGFTLASKKVWVECKRVSSHKKLEANVRKACNQLDVILRRKLGASNRGLVAIDVSKLFYPGDDLYVTENESQLEFSTESLLDRFIEDHSEVWQRVYQKKNQKILGTLFRFSVIATSEEDNLRVHTAQWAVNPRHGLSVAEQSFMQQLTSCLNAPRLT